MTIFNTCMKNGSIGGRVKVTRERERCAAVMLSLVVLLGFF